MNVKVYRWCAVPRCVNTTIKTPNKLFVFVPHKKTVRDKWLKLARRDSSAIMPTTHLYFCEDHFDLPNDMDNYMEYHVMGSVSQVRMKSGCMPTKFQCQSEQPKKRKKQRKTLIEECEKDSDEIIVPTEPTEQVEHGETSCGSSVIMEGCAVEEIVVKPEVIIFSDEEMETNEKPVKKRGKRVYKKNPRPCPDCGKIFQTGYELKKHARTHTGTRPYMCAECGKAYTQPGHLAIHALSHRGIKNFNCTECEAAFYRKTDLDRHLKIHTGDRPFECDICSKSFVQKINFVMHQKTHSGEKPHECQVCFKRFLTRSKLTLHSKRHEKDKKGKTEC